MADGAGTNRGGGAWAALRFLLPYGLSAGALWAWMAPQYASVWQQLGLNPSYERPVALALAFLGLAWGVRLLLAQAGGPKAPVSKVFYDSALDALGDPALVTDAKGRVLYANSPYMALIKDSTAARLVGFDVLYTGYPDFADPIYRLGRASAENRPESLDIRLAAGSSAPFSDPEKPKWLRLSVRPVAANPEGGHTLWRLSDISEDRSKQETSFSRLQYIINYFDQAPVGFFSVTPAGRVDYVNATLAAWLGFDMAEAQSGKLSVTELLGAAAAKVFTALDPVPGSHRVDRFTLPLKGRSAGAGIYTLVNRVDFDEKGNPLPSRCMVMKAEAADKQAENTIAYSALPIGHARLDGEGKVVEANAQFLALSKALARGASLNKALDEDSAKRFVATRKQAVGGEAVQLDAGFVGEVPRSAHLTLVPDEKGKGASVFAIDKTESKMLEQQLAQSQKMQAVGRMSSGIAHDFNNMLTPIIGFADLLLTKMRPTDPAFQDIMSIKQNANRAAGLVRQLLAYSRKQTIQPKACDLSEQMTDLGLLLKRVVGDKVELAISHGRDLWPVMVDIHQLEQAIVNLAANSRDAMPSGGKFTLTTYNLPAAQTKRIGHKLENRDYVVVETADNGSGIPPSVIERIFDPFFTTKDVGKGTGLGLSTVYGFVKQSGGFIYCDSTQGQGTRFSIFLPRLEGQALAEAAKPVAAAAATREDFSGRGRILIVEDEDSVRAFAARALSSRGYTVVEASNGAMGLEKLEEDKDGFELILSDVVMPEMDGPTMLKELRKRGIKTKFIFMSGYAEDAFEKTPDSPTDWGFIQKPFALKQLVEKVKAELG